MQTIDITQLQAIGYGGMSTVYRYSDALAVKVFRQGIARDVVTHEYDMSCKAYSLGMPTPQPHEVIETQSGQHGIVYGLCNGMTLSQAITAHPERLEDYAVSLAELYRQLHSTTVNEDAAVPNAHESEAEAIRRVTPLFGKDGTDALERILDTIPQGDCLIHGDLHPGNIMIEDDRMFLIDMSEMGYGNPLIDIAHVHALMTSGLIDIQRFIGFPDKYAAPLWDSLLRHYYSDKSESELQDIRKRLDTLSLIRCFTWLAPSEGLPEEVITRFQGHFRRLVKIQDSNR